MRMKMPPRNSNEDVPKLNYFKDFYAISLSELFTSGSTLYFTVGVDAMFGFRFFWSFDFCEIISIRAIFVLKHTDQFEVCSIWNSKWN